MTSYWCERAHVGRGADAAVRDRVSVEIAGGRITRVESGTDPAPDAERLRGLVVAGFANAHSHAFHRALRGRTQADRGSFWTWRRLMYAAAMRLDPERYHRLARATYAEMALAGITCVGEFHYVHHDPAGAPYAEPNIMGEVLIDAAAEAGIRITLLDALYLHGGLTDAGHSPVEGVQARFRDAGADAWAARLAGLGGAPHARIGAAIHSARAVDPGAMEVAAAWAAQTGAPLHAHVSEQPAENEACVAAHGGSPTALLEGAGALTATTTSVHGTHLDAADVAAHARAGAGVCLCPTTERDLGDGIGPTHLLAAAGVAMSLGSDSHAVIDHLEEARAVELDERLRSLRRGTHAAADLLTMATAAGHAALGWSDAGAIEVGARADLVAIALDSVRTAGGGAAAPLEAAVFAATAADVTDVVVDGARVVAGGRHERIDGVARELEQSITALLAPS